MKTTTQELTGTEQGIFNVHKHTLFVHTGTCRDLKKANVKRGLVLVDAESLPGEILEMQDRGDAANIKRCPCLDR